MQPFELTSSAISKNLPMVFMVLVDVNRESGTETLNRRWLQ